MCNESSRIRNMLKMLLLENIHHIFLSNIGAGREFQSTNWLQVIFGGT